MTFSKQDYIDWPQADFTQFINKQGHWGILTPFLEMQSGDNPVYSLRMVEHKGLPSAYQIISNSVSEYDAAMKTAGDWSMWLRWKTSKALWEGILGKYKGTGLRHAIEAMEARIASEALASIIQKSNEGDYRAAKDLVTWNLPKQKTGKKVSKVSDDTRENIIDLASRIAK